MSAEEYDAVGETYVGWVNEDSTKETKMTGTLSAHRGRKPLCRCGSEDWVWHGRNGRAFVHCLACGGVPGKARLNLAIRVADKKKSVASTPSAISQTVDESEAEVTDERVETILEKDYGDTWDDLPEAPGWTPSADDFITLKGKQYLPARRRIQWMRGGTPEAHPEWGIATSIIQFERGERLGVGRVKGGYACVKAVITDDTGRVIAEGMKTEWSENFGDFLEKAETGAIARALAVAGYGTETALDLDDGAEGDRPADAPVEQRSVSSSFPGPRGFEKARPVPVVPPSEESEVSRPAPTITPSTAARAEHGGRQPGANTVQVSEVFRLASQAHLSLRGLVASVAATLSIPAPELPDDAEEARPVIVGWMEAMTADELGRVISALLAAAPSKLSEDIIEMR